MNLAERIQALARQDPTLPPVRFVCSLVYNRTLDDQRHEFKCSGCGDTQIVSELLGATETRPCQGRI